MSKNNGCGYYCGGCMKVRVEEAEYLCPVCKRRLRLGTLIEGMAEGSSLYRISQGDWEYSTQENTWQGYTALGALEKEK